jgi:hypothetical protein
MNSILPKHEDLEKVGQKVAFEIFMEDMKNCTKCGEGLGVYRELIR